MNPFTPGFGTTPYELIGRDELLGQLQRMLTGRFDPHRTVWLRGERGTGKTVLLNEIQDLAGQAGWAVVQEDAQTPGSLTARIVRRLTADHLPLPPKRRLKGASLSTPFGGGGIELTDGAAAEVRLRDVIAAVLAQPNPPTGVLVTIDEIHTADREEVAEFGNAIQHLLRQDRPIAAVLAGLPIVDRDDVATFLTRCTKPPLDELSPDAVRVGLQHTAAAEGGGFSTDALELATRVAAGYPYMVQLVGYWSWEASGDGRITVADVHRAIGRCEHELTEAVTALPARALPAMEQRYLEIMAAEDGAVSTGEIARRLGKTRQYANVLRTRLIERGLVKPVGSGLVDFAVPGHRARLRLAGEQSTPFS